MVDDEREVKPNSFLAMWCSEGLECLFELTNRAEAETWAALKGEEPPKIPFNINAMMLRARFNPQRFYEIYTFTTSPSISKATLEETFEENPQFIVEWIRKNGAKIYSDYPGVSTRIKIT